MTDAAAPDTPAVPEDLAAVVHTCWGFFVGPLVWTLAEHMDRHGYDRSRFGQWTFDDVPDEKWAAQRRFARRALDEERTTVIRAHAQSVSAAVALTLATLYPDKGHDPSAAVIAETHSFYIDVVLDTFSMLADAGSREMLLRWQARAFHNYACIRQHDRDAAQAAAADLLRRLAAVTEPQDAR